MGHGRDMGLSLRPWLPFTVHMLLTGLLALRSLEFFKRSYKSGFLHAILKISNGANYSENFINTIQVKQQTSVGCAWWAGCCFPPLDHIFVEEMTPYCPLLKQSKPLHFSPLLLPRPCRLVRQHILDSRLTNVGANPEAACIHAAVKARSLGAKPRGRDEVCRNIISGAALVGTQDN